MYAIQEAKDRAGFWRPIERMGSACCGNGAWALALRFRHMAVLLARKYDGPFATRLRIRLQNGESRYVTGAYPGRIDERQFTVSGKNFTLSPLRVPMDKIYDLPPITMHQAFVEFLELLNEDFLEYGSQWENNTLPRYLDSDASVER